MASENGGGQALDGFRTTTMMYLPPNWLARRKTATNSACGFESTCWGEIASRLGRWDA